MHNQLPSCNFLNGSLVECNPWVHFAFYFNSNNMHWCLRQSPIMMNSFAKKSPYWHNCLCVLADTPYVTDLLMLLQYNSTVNKQVLIFRRQMALVLYILCIFFLPIGKEWVVFAKCRTVHWENTDFKHVFSLKEHFY